MKSRLHSATRDFQAKRPLWLALTRVAALPLTPLRGDGRELILANAIGSASNEPSPVERVALVRGRAATPKASQRGLFGHAWSINGLSTMRMLLLLIGSLAILPGAFACQKKPTAPTGPTFTQVGDAAYKSLTGVFFQGEGWLMCVPDDCFLGPIDEDWGADDMTYALYLRWSFTKDPAIVTTLKELNGAGSLYGTCTAANCPSWSDVPQWDSVAASREYEATGDPVAQQRAIAAFNYVDTATQFALGACPEILYQQPIGDANNNLLKTLETDSNYIKAGLLLYQSTGDMTYVTKAAARYQDVRDYYLDSTVPMYTAYVVDDGTSCAQIPRRFFASVNGNMIWSGLALAIATGQASYRADAIATAQEIAQNMNDSAGVFADLQVECDVVEPLVEAMYELATTEGQGIAKDWILTNAKALGGDISPGGGFGRFFDGPPPTGWLTGWQTNGGFALAFAAEALDPAGTVEVNPWEKATFVTEDISTLPSTLTFKGSGIALVGTVGEQPPFGDGHCSVLVDGVQTFDQSGIWQNETELQEPITDSILFAWRWNASGSHTLQFQADGTNPKEGGPFLHVQGYYLLP